MIFGGCGQEGIRRAPWRARVWFARSFYYGRMLTWKGVGGSEK